MAMNDATWARHANPWSFWTRVPLLMMLTLAIWSRVWIGWWCLLPVAALVVWTFINARVFAPPADLDDWASRAVLGERSWLARKDDPIPPHHARAALVLSSLSGISLIPAVYGLWMLDPWAAFLGAALASAFKLWFCDRMAWLTSDLRAAASGDGNQHT
ncbi:DUF6653 family protein [Hoeflea sp.]|uniref:DUF6653 family protein n=1 Tax=Hoeflea sp. TaxID=1940281 RepID=UPI003BAFE898